MYNEVISSIIEEIKGKKKGEEGAHIFLEEEKHFNDKRDDASVCETCFACA